MISLLQISNDYDKSQIIGGFLTFDTNSIRNNDRTFDIRNNSDVVNIDVYQRVGCGNKELLVARFSYNRDLYDSVVRQSIKDFICRSSRMRF